LTNSGSGDGNRFAAHAFQHRPFPRDVTLLVSSTNIWEILIRLGAAIVFGAVIGIDREWRNKPAGIRTHMMVALAAATFTVITLELFEVVKAASGEKSSTDPLRLVEAITAGVAFLGAGAIIQSRGTVEGITTGSGIWLAGAVGYASGAGYYVLGAIATVLALVILTVLGWVVGKVKTNANGKDGAESSKNRDA
jgi:putative Mg2+ transporter-C (MgtC) family protein